MSPTVVLVVGAAMPRPGDVAGSVQQLRDAGGTVTVLSHGPLHLDGVPVTVVDDALRPTPRRGPLPLRLARFALRVVLRRTPAATFARRALGRTDVLDTVRAADVLVAGDSTAIELVWSVARRVPGPAAVNGVPAAVAVLRRAPA